MSTFLPLLNLSSNPYFPPVPKSDRLPLIPSDKMGEISSKQLIEALVKLSKREVPLSSASNIEGLVMEVCMGYVGYSWRSGSEGEEGVEDIAKKLTEVEFEVGLLLRRKSFD
jgi:hypothetical protein